MANFTTDTEQLSCTIELDDEHPSIDLTTGIGADILDELGRSLYETASRQCDPNGIPWHPLTKHTIFFKGHDHIGVRTGSMLSRPRFQPGTREINPRRATWSYTHAGIGMLDYIKAYAFHHGNKAQNRPARPLFAWPQAVIQYANAVLIDR